MNLANYRENYSKDKLNDDNLPDEPGILFEIWFTEVLNAGVEDPTAMVLATSGKDGFPSARMVLLKGLDPRGFIFFTNYLSRKGQELEDNPNASLLFFWKDFQRQVRIEGQVMKLASRESDAYFLLRPEESKVSSSISPQSKVIPGRSWLEDKVQEFKVNHPQGALSRPDNWGGYLLIPRLYEFWQGRENRLHDRIEFRSEGTYWKRYRLAP